VLSVIDKISLTSISICKSNIDKVSWAKTNDILKDIFSNHDVKIAICTNKLSISPLDDRLRILREYHDSATGGHKGITKTYWHIKERYNWSNMKMDIQNYIQNYRNCQRKKFVRVKTNR